MFVRVKRYSGVFEFSLVDADLNLEKPVAKTILEIGAVEEALLNSWQAWYAIADNLVTADLDSDIKCSVARDLSEWLPPISRELLIESRKNDLRDLAEIGSDIAKRQLEEPILLNENDPLTKIADWLNS